MYKDSKYVQVVFVAKNVRANGRYRFKRPKKRGRGGRPRMNIEIYIYIKNPRRIRENISRCSKYTYAARRVCNSVRK